MQVNEVRKELHFNTELLILIETLKNVAGAQYHLMEREKRKRFARFMRSFADFFRVVHLADLDDPLVRAATDTLGVVVVTSDAGFMGGLNTAVLEAALAAGGESANGQSNYLVIGEKGANFFRDAGIPFKFFQGASNETRYERAVEIRDCVVKEVLERRMGKVVVVYPRPLSFTRQVVETTVLLPCATLFEASATADGEDAKEILGEKRVVVESMPSAMVEHLAGVWITANLFEILEDSKLSEFAARAMHLEGSLQKLQEEGKKLKYRFFRAAHEYVDKGMRESFTSKKLRDTQKAEKVSLERKAGSK